MKVRITEMENINIILFLCNWGPHAAYQTLQDSAAEIPAEVKMVRIPCTGRISKALLFKSFEMGADGVALVGCEPGTCRYGTGTENARQNVEDTRGILELLGLGRDRLRLATFKPEESEALHRFLTGFSAEIKGIGKSPVSPHKGPEPAVESNELIGEIVAAHDVYACQDCGKCSSACPLTLAGKHFSPRVIANAAITGAIIDSEPVRKDVWSCLTCGLCYDRCPSAVHFSDFIREIRHVLKNRGSEGYPAHGGFFHSLMRTMTTPGLEINHWAWLPKDVRHDPDSKVLFFGGCAPYFDVFFKKHLGVRTSGILVDSLRILNFFDIYPSLLQGERCCGHDLLWSGDKDGFMRLARLNVDAIHNSGIEEVITACPECYRSLVHDYPAHGIELGFKVTHILERIEKEIEKGPVEFKEFNHSLTFQDPCRLSRFENQADLPRRLINRLNPADFKEMRDRGASAICCGNCAWTGCDAYSKALQVKRIRQAKETGADLLVTACPKCQIHLTCAMEDPFLGEELNMPMMDLVSVLAETIQWK